MSPGGLLQPGAVVASYVVEGFVGRGGMAAVYRATHPQRDAPVALKLIAPDSRWGADAQERFEREAQLAAAVSHRAILPVYETGRHQGQPFVAMRLESRDLEAVLREVGRLDARRAVTLVSHIASALDAAHAHGLVHRDVKPSNVLVGEEEGEERAYLADFGAARAMFADGDAPAGALVGTVGYASPEQIRGESVDRRTDVYALGCLLYECLTGRPPYSGRDALATLWAHLHAEAPRPSVVVPALPRAIDDVVQRALSKPREARFGSAGELAEAARAAIEDEAMPALTTMFLGRQQELHEVSSLLRETRLLSVTGPGGAGKTRFALEFAAQLRKARSSDYEDGVFASFLASLRDPALVLPTIAETLSVHEQPGKSALDALSAQLGERRILLLLDNVEHLLSASDELARLLEACPGVTLLVTSRERLRLMSEVTYELPALAHEESIALFCERAGCEPSEPLAELCARLEGLPLAIELAAARLSVLSPKQLLARLSERLDLLSAGRDADPRQQTLRATIEWSYDLLSPHEQSLFARLAVFAGSFEAEAARIVCEADLDELRSLVDKSLIRRSGTDRFDMLETIREYARERFGERPDAHALQLRHAERMIEVAERAGGSFWHTGDAARMALLAAEQDDVRAALTWSLDFDLTIALRLAANLPRYWFIRGSFSEAAAWFNAIVGRVRTQDEARRDVAFRDVLTAAGVFARLQHDYARAARIKSEVVVLLREVGDQSRLAWELNELALVATAAGEWERAEELLEESLAIHRSLGDPSGIAGAIHGRGELALARGEWARANADLELAVAMCREVGDEWNCAAIGHTLGEAARRSGDGQAAARHYTAAMEIGVRVESAYCIAECLEGLAGVAIQGEDWMHAANLAGAAEAMLERAGAAYNYPSEHEKLVAAVRAAVPEDELGAAWKHGRSLTQQEAVRLATAVVATASVDEL